MKTYEHRAVEAALRRSHPWSTGAGDITHRYHDFRARPELIPLVLEDFRPWDSCEAIRSFYGLLSWLNGDASRFESNDCAFVGPEENVDAGFGKRLQCSGRLGVLFRDLGVNTSEAAIRRLIADLHARLRRLEPDFAWGAIGTTRLRVHYLDLPKGRAEGFQVLISFWAWGDDAPEVLDNLARVVSAMREALESIGR